ncbi:transmembrane protein [Mycobacterium tuberculosis]|nr:transmembrane protein [Mycobacterium tuberculosis]
MASGTGLLAVWSRQTVAAGHPGPGIGLIVAWITAIVLTFHWAQVVWSRTIVQLAAEERRRRVVAQQQCKTLLDHVQTDSEAGTTPDPRHRPLGASGQRVGGCLGPLPPLFGVRLRLVGFLGATGRCCLLGLVFKLLGPGAELLGAGPRLRVGPIRFAGFSHLFLDRA